MLTSHRAASEKYRHAVFGIVVEEFRPQSVVVLVLKLDDIPAEFREVGIDMVFHFLALQLGLLLDDSDIAHGIYDPRVHVPQGGVAVEICVVVEKHCRTGDFPVAHPVYFQQLRAFSAQQTY